MRDYKGEFTDYLGFCGEKELMVMLLQFTGFLYYIN